MQTKGGAFLIEERQPEDIFTPEDFSEVHLDVARTADEFYLKEIAPHTEALQHQEPGLARSILQKAGELGLLAIHVPEQYGGMELDLASVMIATERLAGDGSYAATQGAHAGIGTLPILFYGTPAQKAQYLPRLATGELVGAYCLTEPHAGSDALAARTRADLTEDGTHYILNGQKMWITNGGFADLFTVFAKIGGEQFTAFLVDRGYQGVSTGAEEKKMGIKGSSTTAVYFDNVRVPVGNVLGEIGRGHIIAFNILNIGRLKLGAGVIGGAKATLGISLKYAQERKAFGHSIADFGAIQHKLAEMAIRIFAAESLTWRVVGQIEALLDKPENALKAIEEFAVECAIVKVYASEALDYVADEGVQIHGGYGYHQDYAVERAYRDSRINRIFEGTNEINRLLTTGMLLKRAARGQLGLVQAAMTLQSEILAGPSLTTDGDEELRLVRNAKKIALMTMGVAYQRYLAQLEQQQEVLCGIADIVMEVFAMESALLRTRKMKLRSIAADMLAVLLRDSMARIETTARTLLAGCAAGDTLRTHMAVLRRFAKYDPVDAIALRRKIAARLLETGKYVT